MRRFNVWTCSLVLLAVCFIGCVMDSTGISHLLSSIKVDHFESDLEKVQTRLHLTGSLLCTELEVEY